MQNDQYYMQFALDEAKKAIGRTSPNPMVGAVIVKNGKIVGKGYHAKAGTPHAEVHAIANARENTKDATIYVTLEPCNHFGRTPPCTQAIIKAGIAEVVVAMQDPNPLVAGKGLKTLQDAGITVRVGVLEEEVKELNRSFIKYITTKTPYVTYKVAMSLDGKIATSTGKSKWITGEVAREYVHNLRDINDAIMVGIGTILADNPSLTTRLSGIEGKNPIRIIMDSKLQIPLSAKVLEDTERIKTIIATTAIASKTKISEIESKGASVVILPDSNGQVDLKALMQYLADIEISSVLLEGGGKLGASALQSSIVDKILFFYAPILIGGESAPGPFMGQGIPDLTNAIRLRNLNTKILGKDILIEADVNNGQRTG